MSTDQTTNLGLPFLMPAQAQKHVTVNESLTRLNALVQTAVESRSVSAQPGSPADGALWIVPPGKTGAEWGGYANWALAYYRDGAWEALAPNVGWRVWVKDERVFVRWTGSSWSAALPATTIELGHESDTTLTRVASGRIAVEGVELSRVSAAETLTNKTFGDSLVVSTSGSTAGGADNDEGVFRNEAGNAGIDIIASVSASSRIAFSDTAATLGLIRYNHVADAMEFYCGGVLRGYFDVGFVLGSPTGGDKGGGSLNAQAVYDDNTLLSCYVFDAALDGTVDIEAWDARVPDRTHPGAPAELTQATRAVTREVLKHDVVDGEAVERIVEVESVELVFDTVPVIDETGDPVMVTDETGKSVQKTILRPVMVETPAEPDTLEPRVHDGARRFAARLGDAYDPLTLDGYARHWKDKRHLTSMPNEASFDPETSKLSTGDWVQRLVETVEIQAVLIERLNERLKTVEARAATRAPS